MQTPEAFAEFNESIHDQLRLFLVQATSLIENQEMTANCAHLYNQVKLLATKVWADPKWRPVVSSVLKSALLEETIK